MQFVPIGFDQQTLAEYSALFSACFPSTNKFTPAYIAWLYVRNPDGNAFGFDAREDGVLAAHYVCIPAQARIDGRTVRVLLSLNTATHPRFQGQGLFTKLAAMTFDAAAGAGFEGIYGVANANSTPGFIRKLGFQLVRPLDALVGVGRTGAVDDRARPCAFERLWTTQALDWRCANPDNPVACRRRVKSCARQRHPAVAATSRGAHAHRLAARASADQRFGPEVECRHQLAPGVLQ